MATRPGNPTPQRAPRRFLALVVGAAVLLGASGAEASSRYSLRGNGETILAGRADARALGGAEAASRAPSLTANPANLAFAERVRFYGSWETEWIRSEEPRPEGTLVGKEYSGVVPNLGLVYPLPRNFALGIGLLVERRKDGEIRQGATAPAGEPYEQVFEAEGNAIRIPALLAWKSPRVQWGTGIDLLLVNSRVRWRNRFGDGSDFLDSNDLDKTSLWGVAWRSGVRVPLRSRVAVGAWTSLSSGLDGSRRFENDDTDDSDNLKVEFDGEYATQYGAGVEFLPLDPLRLVLDYTYEGWESVDAVNPIDTFVDVHRISVGAEWTSSSGEGLRWPIRAGYRTEPLHVQDANGDEIRESAVSVGSGFGFAGGRGEIDWYLEYGWRGVVDESEYYEQDVRFGVTLTGFESWSRRRPPEEDDDW